jgi:hypothetical protein
MIRKPLPEEPAGAVRWRGMARLAGVYTGVAVLSVRGGAVSVAVTLPGAAHHATGTASVSASNKSSAPVPLSATLQATSGPAVATSGGS